MPLHKVIKQKPGGKVVIIGDVHGHIDIVNRTLKEVSFDPEKDICISVGDLIDKGPNSLQCLQLVKEDWVEAIEGNHERMLRTLMEDPSSEKEKMWRHNGGTWWFDDITKEERQEAVDLVQGLPIALTLERVDGSRIGIVHAEPPSNNWDVFIRNIDDDSVQKTAQWSRQRILLGEDSPVTGIDLVVVGHTPVKEISSLGNTVYIDTNLHETGVDNGPLPYLDDTKLDELVWNLSTELSHDNDLDLDDSDLPENDFVNHLPTL